MVALWRPWEHRIDANTRTVQVTGTATLEAEPDEYVFSPNYIFKNADKGTAISDATKKQNDLTAKLKNIGVADKQIKTNLDGYEDYPPVYYGANQVNTPATYNYTLMLTVTVGDRNLAQRVQDYLATTSPEGAVTPNITFSDAKQKELENKARGQASADARAKADQSAKNLGFKVRAVKSVTDGQGFGDTIQPGCGPTGLCSGVDLNTGSTEKSSLAVQPGQDKYSFSVTVTYYIR
jgi:uncharacterized protein YggE